MAEPDDNVEIEKEEDPLSKEVEVDLEEKKGDDKPKDTADDDKIEKLAKRNEYLNRQLQKALKTINDVADKFNAPQPEPEPDPQAELDELDQLAQKDWKKAVRKLAAEEAAQHAKELAEQRQKETREAELNDVLENSRNRVRNRYADVEVEGSEINKRYIEAMNENPQFANNVYGPELTMYKMEEKMRADGIQPPPIRQEILQEADAEVQRRTRAGMSSLPTNRSGSKETKVTLTEGEIQAAKTAGVKLSEFAKMKKLKPQDFREGVTVDE